VVVVMVRANAVAAGLVEVLLLRLPPVMECVDETDVVDRCWLVERATAV